MVVKKKTKLFSVSIHDCSISTFKGSGCGGQKRQKTSSGIRVIHTPSGAIGKASDAREQYINKRTAFRRMAETKEFKNWVKVQTAKLQGKPSIEELVDELMQEQNLKVEIKDSEGAWIVGDINE